MKSRVENVQLKSSTWKQSTMYESINGPSHRPSGNTTHLLTSSYTTTSNFAISSLLATSQNISFHSPHFTNQPTSHVFLCSWDQFCSSLTFSCQAMRLPMYFKHHHQNLSHHSTKGMLNNSSTTQFQKVNY